MNDFNIDQYEITVSFDNDTKEKSEGPIEPKLYPVLNPIDVEDSIEPPVPKPEEQKTENNKSEFRDWLLDKLNKHRQDCPEKIALIEEIGEARCITYEELIDGSKRAAIYMQHHGVKHSDRVLMCMENTVEFVFYQLGAFFLGAIPVLVNPSHIASDILKDITCTTAVVDFEHYGHLLRLSVQSLKSIQRIFVLAEDIATISLAHHVWVIDGFGFLSFPSNFDIVRYESSDDTAFIIPGSLENNHYISHSQNSAFFLCHDYFNLLFNLIASPCCSNFLITDGLHCHDALMFLFTILIRGETCVLSESTLDVWRASLLDRIASIIEQYKIPLLFSNSQLLRCFIKYDVQKIYDLSSLKIIANHGEVLSVSTATKIKKVFDVILIQVYSGAEFGVASFGIFEAPDDENLVNCGIPADDMKIKVADAETGKEMPVGKWGEVILSGRQLFHEYLDEPAQNSSRKFGKSWFKTGDYGMIDEKGQVHVAGAIADLITAQGKIVSSEVLESILSKHKMINDVVVMQVEQQVWCGVLLKDEKNIPSVATLEKLLQKNQIPLTIKKVVVLDFIPRSEKGKVIRNEIPYIMNAGQEEDFVEGEIETAESYI